VLLAAALLALLLHQFRDEMDTEEIRKNRYWVAKTRNPNRYPVVFGGDSRVFRGISPEDFSRGMDGVDVHNYAYWSMGMGRAYLDGIGNKVDTGAGLKLIVLGITPHSLTPRAARCEHYLYEMGRPREQVLQLLYLSRLQEVFAPFRALDLAGRLLGRHTPNNYRIRYHDNGWVESWWLVPDTSYSAQFYREIFTDNRVSDEVIDGLTEYVKRWRAMGIMVAGFRPPTSHAIRQLEEEKGGFDEAGFVRRFEAAGGIWIPLDNDAYQTFDGNHLEHQSARRLSADLAAALKDRFRPGG
jgi:hypothetical protein